MDEAQARAELRARQGVGARYDAETAPAEELLWARRGTAYLARQLNELTDTDLELPGAHGVARRTIIARVAYEARALALAFEAIRVGGEGAVKPEGFDIELDDARTLPAHALRYLFAHSQIHLNVEWRDLPDTGWSEAMRHSSGWALMPKDAVLLRARDVWGSAIALDNGARPGDVPLDLIVALERQAERFWRAQGVAAQLPPPTERARWLLGVTASPVAGLPPLPTTL